MFRSRSGPVVLRIPVLFRSSGPGPGMRFRSVPGSSFRSCSGRVPVGSGPCVFRSVPVLVFGLFFWTLVCSSVCILSVALSGRLCVFVCLFAVSIHVAAQPVRSLHLCPDRVHLPLCTLSCAYLSLLRSLVPFWTGAPQDIVCERSYFSMQVSVLQSHCRHRYLPSSIVSVWEWSCSNKTKQGGRTSKEERARLRVPSRMEP